MLQGTTKPVFSFYPCGMKMFKNPVHIKMLVIYTGSLTQAATLRLLEMVMLIL